LQRRGIGVRVASWNQAARRELRVDPARRLVVASHWGEDIGRLLAEVSAAVPA
jgi:hypothetical protein